MVFDKKKILIKDSISPETRKNQFKRHFSTFQYNLYDTKIFEFISWKCEKYKVYFSFKQLEEKSPFQQPLTPVADAASNNKKENASNAVMSSQSNHLYVVNTYW